jgi:hypothetical protein
MKSGLQSQALKRARAPGIILGGYLAFGISNTSVTKHGPPDKVSRLPNAYGPSETDPAGGFFL